MSVRSVRDADISSYTQQFLEEQLRGVGFSSPPVPHPPSNFPQALIHPPQILNAPLTPPTPPRPSRIASVTNFENSGQINQAARTSNNEEPPQIPMPPAEYAKFLQLHGNVQRNLNPQGTVPSVVRSVSALVGPPPGAISISHPNQAYGMVTPPMSPVQQGPTGSPRSPSSFHPSEYNVGPGVLTPPLASPSLRSVSEVLRQISVPNNHSPPDGAQSFTITSATQVFSFRLGPDLLRLRG
jgi:hypothetical protein